MDKRDQLIKPGVAELSRALAEAFGAFAEAFRAWLDFWKPIVDALVPRKWVHLAVHARKGRTRKKYKRMIADRVTLIASMMGGAAN